MSPFLRTIVFTVFVPGFWTVLVPYWIVGRRARLDLSGAGIAGWLLVAVGVALYLTCAFWGFALRGKGTPAPIDPPKKLVVQGPYRIVRNPMYWSVLFVILGEALAFRSPALAEVACAFFAGAALFVMVYEEPLLRNKFGAGYEAYRKQVPRWIPRFKNRLD
ncbi:MAG TPA: isoprenylcysteine carboxylmethyltransferase family protein [Candidatus Saccharimonadales bacterium]|jgi:protein-S-isoprenylcysteine O-methyltransferase Ste14|nr:isoprenylcysteine carboxylmethyltransferase family protein [Candidatus Saccharimonadales bacterium]